MNSLNHEYHVGITEKDHRQMSTSKIKVAGMFLLGVREDNADPVELDVVGLKLNSPGSRLYYESDFYRRRTRSPKPEGHIVLRGHSPLSTANSLHGQGIVIYAYHGEDLFRCQIERLSVSAVEIAQHQPTLDVMVRFSFDRVTEWVQCEHPRFLAGPEHEVSVIGHTDPDCEYYGFRQDREF